MSKCKIARLPDRGVIRIEGNDAKNFLQALITNDIEQVSTQSAIHAALLTPQGKILFDFFIIEENEGFFLETALELIPELSKRLIFYKLRADVLITDFSDRYSVFAAWGRLEVPDQQLISYTDPRNKNLGLRIISPANNFDLFRCDKATAADYLKLRISLGIPEGGLDFEYGDVFPHEALYDQLNGVDFGKGCYIGQEVVSRMHHRANVRKRIIPVEGASELPPSGTEIQADGLVIGKLGSVCGNQGLAMLRLDRAEKSIAADLKISVMEIPLKLLQPDWASFNVPQN